MRLGADRAGGGGGWRHLEAPADGGAGAPAGPQGGGASAPAAPQSPAPPPAPAGVDPAEHARVVMELARANARVEFPQADLELLATAISPEQAALIARRTHEAVAARVAASSEQQPAPVPPANSISAAESEEQRRLREAQYQIRRRHSRGPRTTVEPWAAEDLRQDFFRISWNRHMEHRRTGRGDVGAPPRFTPASAALPPPGQAF